MAERNNCVCRKASLLGEECEGCVANAPGRSPVTQPVASRAGCPPALVVLLPDSLPAGLGLPKKRPPSQRGVFSRCSSRTSDTLGGSDADGSLAHASFTINSSPAGLATPTWNPIPGAGGVTDAHDDRDAQDMAIYRPDRPSGTRRVTLRRQGRAQHATGRKMPDKAARAVLRNQRGLSEVFPILLSLI